MNSINKLAVTPAFMTALLGTALACVGLGIWAVVSWGERPAALVLAGSALYLVGAIVVTMAANVPMNERWRTSTPAAPTPPPAGAATSPTGPHGTTSARPRRSPRPDCSPPRCA